MRHSCVGHNYLGHTHMGHIYISYDYMGRNYLGAEEAAAAPVGGRAGPTIRLYIGIADGMSYARGWPCRYSG